VPALTAVTQQNIIMPKLFRRIAEYLENGGGIDRDGFLAFLQAKADRIWIISTGQRTHLDTFVQVEGSHVTLTEPPENIVFYE
jgi:hypothetical protein